MTAGSGRTLAKGVLPGVLLMVAFVLVTTHWVGGTSPDTKTYIRIAEAAPGFPTTDVGSAFSERFGWCWIGGVIGDLFGSTRAGLWIVIVASQVVTVAALVAICAELRLGTVASLLCTGLFVANPYTFRLFFQDPGPVDPLFVCGVAVMMWGLVARRVAPVWGGGLIAILARQTALLAVPAATVWVYFGEGWRDRDRRQRILLVLSMVVGVLAVWIGLRLASESWTYFFAPKFPDDTILPGVGDPGTLHQLGGQVARVAVPIVPVAGCIAGVLFAVRRAIGRLDLPVEFWCSLLIGAAILVQPLVISPNFEGFEGNQPRIAALGVFPVCVALAYALRGNVDRLLQNAPPWAWVAGALALAASSLHEKFSIVGPSTHAQFVVIELVAAVALAALLAFTILRSPGNGKGPR